MQTHCFENNFSFDLVNKQENKFLILASLFLFTLPLLPLNQLIVGTIVNAILIKYSITFKSKKVFLLSIIPSTAVLVGGILFSNLTLQIALMLPFIWGANFILMILTRKLFIKEKKNYFLSTSASAAVKTIVLFLAAFVLFYLGAIPLVFLTMFGVMQFITAESGAVMVYLLGFIRKNFFI